MIHWESRVPGEVGSALASSASDKAGAARQPGEGRARPGRSADNARHSGARDCETPRPQG